MAQQSIAHLLRIGGALRLSLAGTADGALTPGRAPGELTIVTSRGDIARIDCKNVTKRCAAFWARSLLDVRPVNLRFTSTLSSEDENRIAPVILKMISEILDLLPVSYMLRIDTVDAHVYQIARPSDTPSSVVPFIPPGDPSKDD